MKERKMNNKGFSLVELIIVIAIMAILIVVLAPQYLKYVERSRNSTDLQNATELKTAIETYVADPESKEAMADGDTVVLTLSTNAAGTVTGTGKGATLGSAALTSAGLTIADIKCSSKTKWNKYEITGTMQENGALKWTYKSWVGTTNNTAFEDAMNGKSST